METSKKVSIINIILLVLSIIFLTGSVYFVVYNPLQEDSTLASIFYVGLVISVILLITFGRKNISRQLKDGYSEKNYKKTILGLIFLIIGSSIINIIVKYIGGSYGYTVGLILALVIFYILFLLSKNDKSIF